MRNLIWLPIVSMLILPNLASANELVFGADVRATYDDNLFGRSQNEEEDVSFLAGPYLEFRSDPGDLNYSISYQPLYQAFVDFSEVNNWRHHVNASLSYRPNERTSIYATESFRRTPYILQDLEDGDVALNVDPELEATREDVSRNTTMVGIDHFINPRTRLNVNAVVQSFEPESNSDRLSANQSYSISADLTRALSKKDKIGLGLKVWHQEFDGVRDYDDTDAQHYWLSLSWEHQWARDLALSIKVGPAYVKNDVDAADVKFENRSDHVGAIRGISIIGGGYVVDVTDDSTCDTTTIGLNTYALNSGCGVVTVTDGTNTVGTNSVLGSLRETSSPALDGPLPSPDDTTLTYYAEIEFIKRWEQSSLALHYLRSASSQSGLETSTIRDSVELRGRHQFSKRFKSGLSLRWNQNESASDQPVVRALYAAPGTGEAISGTGLAALTLAGYEVLEVESQHDTSSLGAYLNLTYDIDRHSQIFLGSSYTYLTSGSSFRGASGETTRVNIWRTFVGYRIRFEPIDL